MRVLPIFFSFTLLALTAFHAQAYGYVAPSKKSGYVELGIGATQFEIADKYLTDYDIPPSPSLKVLFGGRIGRSQNTWFEFTYAYNGAFKTEDTTTSEDEVTTYRSQSIAMGFKLTTAPYKKASAYLRAGGGRLMLETREEYFTSGTSNRVFNSYDTSLTNHFYAGLGANFALGRKGRLGIEAQQMQYKVEEISLADTTVMMTFTRFLK